VTLAEGASSEVEAQVARLRSLEGGVRAFGDVVSFGPAAIQPLEEPLRHPSSHGSARVQP